MQQLLDIIARGEAALIGRTDPDALDVNDAERAIADMVALARRALRDAQQAAIDARPEATRISRAPQRDDSSASIADAALDAACFVIQSTFNQPHGDVAAQYFSGDNPVRRALEEYVRSERQWAIEEGR